MSDRIKDKLQAQDLAIDSTPKTKVSTPKTKVLTPKTQILKLTKK